MVELRIIIPRYSKMKSKLLKCLKSTERKQNSEENKSKNDCGDSDLKKKCRGSSNLNSTLKEFERKMN